MPVASEQVWNILYTVSRYLFPFLAAALVLLVLFYILSESKNRLEKVRAIPGSGTVGELMVVAGSRDLDAGSWFPVPREGVLGSVRSCDLVIPCPGVHSKHLDFSWEDGTGLLIHPRTGCEVLINGIPVTCRSRSADIPLTHGGILQVGSAILRLHLFAALDNTASVFPSLTAESPAEPVPSAFPPPQNIPAGEFIPAELPDSEAFKTPPPLSSPEIPVSGSTEIPPCPETKPDRPHRSDRWKVDLGE